MRARIATPLRCTVQGPHHGPPRHGDRDLQGPGNQVPGDLGECRRRLRHEGRRSIPNIRWSRSPRGSPAAGEMDLRARRGAHLRRALPRQHHRGRAGARRGRPLPRLARAHAGQSRRLLRLGPSGWSRHQQYRRARRDLHDAGDPCGRDRRPHQHHGDRPLSRRRPARGRLCGGDPGRPGGAQARDRSGRAAPAQHDSRRRDAVQDRAGLHLRLRRLRQEPRGLPGAGGLCGVPRPPRCRAAEGKAARDRRRQHGRGVERRPDRARGDPLRPDRRA